MSGLSQEARALIEGTAALDEPSAGDKSRIQQRLMLQLGAAAFATSMLSTAAAGSAAGGTMTQASGTAAKGLGSVAPRAFWLSGLGKALVGAAALAGVGIAWWVGAASPSEQAVSAPRAVAPAVVSQALPAAPPQTSSAPSIDVAQEPAPALAPAAPRAKAAKVKVAMEPSPTAAIGASAASGDTLKAELALLGRAQAALRAGRFQEALALTGEHRSQFPDGLMREERMGVAALAACGLSPDRRGEAEAFLKQAASSPLAARVKKACNLP